MSLEDNVKNLLDFGLTQTQAKVFIVMAKLGISSIGDISKASNVRREEVYRILPKFQELGLIETVLGKPTKIRAIPVKEALSILIKRERFLANERLSKLSTRKDEFLRTYNSYELKPMEEEGKEEEFALLSERDGIISRGLTMIENAKREVNVISSVYQFYQLFLNNEKMARKVTRRGVSVRAILDMSEQAESILKMAEGYNRPSIPFTVRYTYQPICHFINVDENQALISTSTEPLGRNPYLWTRNEKIVKLMRRYFQDTWHSSLNKKDIMTRNASEQAFLLASQLKPSDHAILVYDSPEAKTNVLFNYLKAGFENNEAGVYVASDEEPIQIRQAMMRFGIDVDALEKEGALRVLGYEDVYIINGKFSIDATMNKWNAFYNDAMSRGFKGLRVTGETACFFAHDQVKNLLEYERSLHRTLDIPMIAICAYNADMLSKSEDPINLYNELVRAHGSVLFTGTDNKLGKIEIRRA